MLLLIAILLLVLVLANESARAWLVWLITASVMLAIPIGILAALIFILA